MARQLRRLRLALCALAALPAMAAAQRPTGVITGRVTNRATSDPIPGAQVFVVGTALGARTGDDGRYRIAGVPVGPAQLRVARIGFQSEARAVTVAAGAEVTADFAVAQTAVQLDVITTTVTGEQQRKRETGNAIATIAVDSIPRAATPNFSELLQGKASGVTVLSSGGTTGAGARIRIRGSNSISLSNDPLVIIDGVRVNNAANSTTIGVGGQQPSRFNDINPEDIESIDVLKGPAASALYGTAAANGVLLITTKHGRAGKTRWTAYSEAGSVTNAVGSYPGNYFTVGDWPATPARNGSITVACNIFRQATGECTPTRLASYNPLDVYSPFKTGYKENFGVSASGGGEAVNHFTSVSFQREQGIYPINTLRQINLRSNVHASLTPTVDASFNAGYLISHLRLPQNDNDVLGAISSGLLGKAFDCSPATPCGSDTVSHGFVAGQIPREIFAMDTRQDVNRFVGGGEANWHPASWFRMAGNAGMDVLSRWDNELVPPNRVVFGTLPEGQRTSNRYQITSYTANGSGTASFDLLPTLRSGTSVGVQYQEDLAQGTRAFGAKLLAGTGSLAGTTARFTVNEETIDNKTIGGFVQEELSWKDRVFLTGALRTDKNSAFGTNFGFVNYPSVSLSWVVGEEPWFPQQSVISSLRLRSSYGKAGQKPNFRDAITYYSPVAVNVSGSELPAFTAGGTGNPSLRPEVSAEYEGGMDVGFFGGRASVELTAYRKTTRDVLVARRLPLSAGLTTTRFENLGAMRNSGVEGMLTATLLDRAAAKVELSVSGSHNDNKVLSMGGVPAIYLGFSSSQRIQAGYPAGGYFQKRILGYTDANGNGIIEPAEVQLSDTAVFLGSALPTDEAAVTPTVTLFRSVRLSALLDHRGGYKLFNDTREFRCAQFMVCREAQDASAPLADQAKIAADKRGSVAGYIEDASFWKLREATVTLTVPNALLGRATGRLSGATLTVAGHNLHTWTKYSGFDPEVNAFAQANFTQADFLTQPPVRYYTARLTLTF